MREINFTQKILDESRRILSTGEDYGNICNESVCLRCLVAEAKSNIDEEYDIEFGYSMVTDPAMFEAYEILNSEYVTKTLG